MTWSVDAGTRVDALITQIATRLTASGWTLTDRAADQVWHSTNDHGVTQYIQITEVGTYQYLQFQAWRAWDTGTHAGSNGSGTTYRRLYFASTVVAAATLVDLYMSVTANRFIIFIKGVGNYNNWAYFGGGDSTVGTDPLSAFLITSYETASTNTVGVVLQSYSSGSYWTVIGSMIPGVPGTSDTRGSTPIYNSILAADPTQVLAFPIYVFENGIPYSIRGCLDGLKFIPNAYGEVSNLDTITISGVTWLIVQPGGQTAANTHTIAGNYQDCLAIVEA